MKKLNSWVITLLVFLNTNFLLSQNIVINEVLPSNNSSIKDEDNSYQDWIELYNNGSTTVNLSGYGLSDDPSVPFKWTFPNVNLAAGKYLLIWASDKNRAEPGSPLHTNFKISASGDNVVLTKAGGTTLDQVAVGNMQSDMSYGRLPNGSGPFVVFSAPTPNAENTSAGSGTVLNAPIFSKESGFYTSNFNLTISSTDPGTTIIYTLDGSEPDENNLIGTTYSYKNKYVDLPGQTDGPLLTNSYKTLVYNSPISITDNATKPNKVSVINTTFENDPSHYFPDNPVYKGTIVRAKVIKSGYTSSKIITKNYFISPQGSNKFSLPVVSISINEDRFFEYNNGIYVAGKDFDTWRAANPNGAGKNSKAGNYYRETNDERVGHMNYFVNGEEVINQDIGLKIRGGSTRRYEKKSLTVYARSEYGAGSLKYKFFPDLTYTSYERLTLSNSGWDYRLTKYRDALIHKICKEMHVEIEEYQPAIMFLNGEYWGLTNIRERFDNNYFKRVYNAQNVDILENNANAKEGDEIHYEAMINYVKSNSLANSANYNYIKTQLDPESITDFYITNIFFQNGDWPDNNVQYWRNKTSNYNPSAPYGLDGRWRWLHHDLDATFTFGIDDPNGNTLETATTFNTTDMNPEWSTLLFRKLIENESFKTDFINRFADILNTSFLPSRINSMMDELKNEIAPEMPAEIERWSEPSSLNSWNSYINEQKSFVNVRPGYQRNHIRSKFGISKNINATLNVSDGTHGYVKINTINIKEGTPGITGNPYPWTGIYFSNIPVKLKAISKPGFVFSHWEGFSSSTQDEITITSLDDFSIKAIFVSSGEDLSVPIYFWTMDSEINNGEQLTSLKSTYNVTESAEIHYQSCISGYPFEAGNTYYGKASMERRNMPTDINYRPEANNDIPYSSGIIKGLQIKEPFQKDSKENIMIINASTTGFKNIKLSFAAVNESSNVSSIKIDYSINSGNPVWVSSGLQSATFNLTSFYQLFEVDFSSIAAADNNADFKIRMRFAGSNLTADNGERITFNNIAIDGVKLPLSYPSPNIFSVGTEISNLTPSATKSFSSYSISPSLPTGLSLNTTTGVISGTPTTASSLKTYTVTANYSGGSATFDLIITVNDSSPLELSYPTPNVFTKNSSITSLNPTVSGGTINSFSIDPALPQGLSLNTTNGKISGTPTQISDTKTYVVTASNSEGSATFDLVLTVNDIAPFDLSYPTPNMFTKGMDITTLTPIVSGGTVISYSISPILPPGLTLNTTTGKITGTPSQLSVSKSYLVTASNSGGSTTFELVLTINDLPPSNLSYPTPNVFTKNVAISTISPTISGGEVETYSIEPSLPDGLTLSSSTGKITGTPTQISAAKTYKITATNSGGSTSFDTVISVNDNLDVTSFEAKNVVIYPNPFSNTITITGLNIEFIYTIFSIEGKVIQSKSATKPSLDLSDLPAGIYFLQLIVDKYRITKKIIKDK